MECAFSFSNLRLLKPAAVPKGINIGVTYYFVMIYELIMR